jgi:hypothetical protein
LLVSFGLTVGTAVGAAAGAATGAVADSVTGANVDVAAGASEVAGKSVDAVLVKGGVLSANFFSSGLMATVVLPHFQLIAPRAPC